MQEKQLSITEQSGIVTTEFIPCDFILVLPANIDTIRRIHPSLRSYIREHGYEALMNHSMPDTMENRHKLIQFLAQEVTKDRNIPYLSRNAVLAIILKAKKRTFQEKELSLVLGDLSSLIRAAGDVARKEDTPFTEFIQTTKGVVGRVNTIHCLTDSLGNVNRGHIMQIEVQVVPAQGVGGKITATGSLRVIARESVQNVAVMIKKYSGIDISTMDIHIQFLGVQEIDGDHFAIALASAIMSDLKKLPVRQDIAMIGSLSVDGNVLPIDHVSTMIEGAVSAGIKEVIIPATNLPNVSLDDSELFFAIIPVQTLEEVLNIAIIGYC